MQVLGIFFFILTSLCVLGRIVTRLYTRRRLFLDDAFLVFGWTCLCAANVLCFQMVRSLYVYVAFRGGSDDIIVPTDQFRPLLRLWTVGTIYLCLTWTTMFAVKFSFLILFWHLVQHVSRWLVRYYWMVVGTCVVVWMFVICEPFVQCHYFGIHSGRSGLFSRRLSVFVDDVISEMCSGFGGSSRRRVDEFGHRT